MKNIYILALIFSLGLSSCSTLFTCKDCPDYEKKKKRGSRIPSYGSIQKKKLKKIPTYGFIQVQHRKCKV